MGLAHLGPTPICAEFVKTRADVNLARGPYPSWNQRAVLQLDKAGQGGMRWHSQECKIFSSFRVCECAKAAVARCLYVCIMFYTHHVL